jgi:hypothetical protein
LSKNPSNAVKRRMGSLDNMLNKNPEGWPSLHFHIVFLSPGRACTAFHISLLHRRRHAQWFLFVFCISRILVSYTYFLLGSVFRADHTVIIFLAACMLWKVPARRQTPVYRYAAFCMRRPPPPFQFQETVESLCHLLHCHVRFPESPQRQGQNCVCRRPYVLRLEADDVIFMLVN